MNFKQIIKAFSGIILVLVFALGVTPKQVLHDALTNHEHIPATNTQGDWVGKDRFNCDDENFVAQSPFVSQDIISGTLTLPAHSVEEKIFPTSYSYLHTIFFLQRGPPTIG